MMMMVAMIDEGCVQGCTVDRGGGGGRVEEEGEEGEEDESYIINYCKVALEVNVLGGF